MYSLKVILSVILIIFQILFHTMSANNVREDVNGVLSERNPLEHLELRLKNIGSRPKGKRRQSLGICPFTPETQLTVSELRVLRLSFKIGAHFVDEAGDEHKNLPPFRKTFDCLVRKLAYSCPLLEVSSGVARVGGGL